MMRDGEHVVTVPGRLDRALRALCPGESWETVRRAIKSGKVTVDGALATDEGVRVRAGARLCVRMAAPRPRAGGVLARDAIAYVDAHVVVVHKPAGISSVPYEVGEAALSELVREELSRRRGREGPLGVVQRLDRETSGLIVFARTLAAERHLRQQLRLRTAKRRYLAIAAGEVEAQTFRSRLVRDRGDGKRGSTHNPRLGREAITHVEVVERLRGATLIACRLETGRTHQIRIHLAESGHPLLGERVYAPRGCVMPPAPRLMLHATLLGFEHPGDGRWLELEQPMPDDMQRVVAALRG